MVVSVQGIEFALNSFEQVILIVRFCLTDLMITHKQNTATTAGPEERNFCRIRRTRLPQAQKNETTAGVEERDYYRNETITRTGERDYCTSRRTRLLQDQKNETIARAKKLE